MWSLLWIICSIIRNFHQTSIDQQKQYSYQSYTVHITSTEKTEYEQLKVHYLFYSRLFDSSKYYFSFLKTVVRCRPPVISYYSFYSILSIIAGIKPRDRREFD